MILGLRTDGDETKLILKDGEKLRHEKWVSGRQLSDELLPHIEKLASLHDITGIVVFRGPGSFTSLRIGITTANTLAYSLRIPIVGTDGDRWFDDGIKDLAKQAKPQIITPLYGSEPHVTKPKK